MYVPRGSRRAWCGLSVAVWTVAGCGKPDGPPLAPLPKAAAPVAAAPPSVAAKPEPALDAAALLFPRHAGDVWEMDAKAGDATYHFTLTAIAEPASAAGISIEMNRDGLPVQRETYTADDKGVYR